MPGADPVVRYEVADRIATVTLNRPEARNALNRLLTRSLWEAVADAGDDPAVDVVILTGTDPAFCAGVDLKEITGQSPVPDPPNASDAANPAGAADASDPPVPVGPGPGRDVNGLYRFIPLIDKPVIGAVNGVAATGGFEVALQCTFLVASEKARFVDTHARIGVMPGGGITVFMAQSLGLRRAIEASLTGNFINAAEALSLGLVNHVVPHEELLPFARRLAADIVSNDQVGVRRLLRHYRQVANAATLDEAHLIEGYLAETWRPGTSLIEARRAAVTARGRAQAP